MFTSLLVPLDGSALAETALAAASVLARRFQAELLLVYSPHSSAFSLFAPPPTTPVPEQYLAQVATRLQGEGLRVRTALAKANRLDAATLQSVDLIVLTTRSHRDLETLLHPSRNTLLAQSSAPILAWQLSGDPAPASVQVPHFLTDATVPLAVLLDGSHLAERTLPVAAALARVAGNPLVLVRAAERPYLAGGVVDYAHALEEVTRLARQEVEAYLQRKQAELRSQGFQVSSESGIGPAPEVILPILQHHHVGLLALAAQGQGWLGQVFLGSVAKQLLSQAEVPILLVRLHPTPDHPK